MLINKGFTKVEIFNFLRFASLHKRTTPHKKDNKQNQLNTIETITSNKTNNLVQTYIIKIKPLNHT